MGEYTPFENCVDFVDWLADSIIQCHQDRAMLESNLSGWQGRRQVLSKIRGCEASRSTLLTLSFFCFCFSICFCLFALNSFLFVLAFERANHGKPIYHRNDGGGGGFVFSP